MPSAAITTMPRAPKASKASSQRLERNLRALVKDNHSLWGLFRSKRPYALYDECLSLRNSVRNLVLRINRLGDYNRLLTGKNKAVQERLAWRLALKPIPEENVEACETETTTDLDLEVQKTLQRTRVVEIENKYLSELLKFKVIDDVFCLCIKLRKKVRFLESKIDELQRTIDDLRSKYDQARKRLGPLQKLRKIVYNPSGLRPDPDSDIVEPLELPKGFSLYPKASALANTKAGCASKGKEPMP
jgi:hypothetical protein